MKLQEQQTYLSTLTKELMKSPTLFNNFKTFLEDNFKEHYFINKYYSFPLTESELDTIIYRAEELLGIDHYIPTATESSSPQISPNEYIYHGGGGWSVFTNLASSSRTKETKIEAYDCFCINGREVANYYYDEHEKHYAFYDRTNQLLATIASEPIQIKTTTNNSMTYRWNTMASLFGDADCCVMPSSLGRTNGATSADSAEENNIINEALVEHALKLKEVEKMLKDELEQHKFRNSYESDYMPYNMKAFDTIWNLKVRDIVREIQLLEAAQVITDEMKERVTELRNRLNFLLFTYIN